MEEVVNLNKGHEIGLLFLLLQSGVLHSLVLDDLFLSFAEMILDRGELQSNLFSTIRAEKNA